MSHLEEILKFYEKRMSPKEREVFEKNILANDELAAELELFYITKKGMSQKANSENFNKLLENAKKLSLNKPSHKKQHSKDGFSSISEEQLLELKKSKFNSLEDDLPNNREQDPKILKSTINWIYKIAAIGLIVIGVALSYYFLSQTKPADFDQLYSENLDFYVKSEITLRGENEQFWNDAMEAFLNKEYFKARTFLSKETTHGINNSSVNLLVGLCYLHENNAVSALEYLSLINSENGLFEDAVWYKGLAYLLLKNKNEARKNFEIIVNSPKHQKNQLAIEILKSL